MTMPWTLTMRNWPTCGPPVSISYPPLDRGAMPGPHRGVIDLQVPLLTLMGLAEHPADLAGWAP